jgi:Ribosomal protein L32
MHSTSPSDSPFEDVERTIKNGDFGWRKAWYGTMDKCWRTPLQIGYGSNKKTRHMMPSGHKAFLVNNVREVDLLLMHNRTYAAEYVFTLECTWTTGANSIAESHTQSQHGSESTLLPVQRNWESRSQTPRPRSPPSRKCIAFDCVWWGTIVHGFLQGVHWAMHWPGRRVFKRNDTKDLMKWSFDCPRHVLLACAMDLCRYFQVDSTLGIHPIRLLVFRPLHQQHLTRLNLGSFMLSPNHACSSLLGLAYN